MAWLAQKCVFGHKWYSTVPMVSMLIFDLVCHMVETQLLQLQYLSKKDSIFPF